MEYIQHFYGKLFGGDSNSSDTYYTPRKVVCFGNVLLDRIVKLDEPDLVERYGLKLGSKGEMDLEKLNEMAREAANDLSILSKPGGSALNTVRILKQLGTDAQFFGAVGDDKNAEELRSMLLEQGIEARLQTIEQMHTGQCVCLMHNDNPTLYADIGASAHFSMDQLKHLAKHDTQSFLRPIERKQILYIEGFFVPRRAEVVDYILNDLVMERRHLALNLSAPYIVAQNGELMLKLARRALFVFGNRHEFEEFAKVANCQSVDDLARHLLDTGVTKIILITNGGNGVQLVTNFETELAPPVQATFEDYKAQRVEKIVDATGAGDSFVAGFLHAWLEKRPLSECVRMASNVASKVVTQVGCNLPR